MIPYVTVINIRGIQYPSDEKHRDNNESVMFVSLFVNNDTNMIDYDEV